MINALMEVAPVRRRIVRMASAVRMMCVISQPASVLILKHVRPGRAVTLRLISAYYPVLQDRKPAVVHVFLRIVAAWIVTARIQPAVTGSVITEPVD